MYVKIILREVDYEDDQKPKMEPCTDINKPKTENGKEK
jgi:hypothetical protein